MITFLVAYQQCIDAVFTHRGNCNLKKGFQKHEASAAHQTAIALWKNAEERKIKGKEISTLINNQQLKRNRY